MTRQPACLDAASTKSKLDMYDGDYIADVLANELGMKHSAMARRVVRLLYNRGVLNCSKVEQTMVRQKVARLCNRGVGRCAAMAEVAREMGCSYQKVRDLIYQKN